MVERVPKNIMKSTDKTKLTDKEKDVIISALIRQQDQIITNLSNEIYLAVKKISDEKAKKLKMACILDTADITEKVRRL